MHSKTLPNWIKIKIILLTILLWVVLPVQASAQDELIAMDGQKIVTASSVRIRSQSSLEAEVVGRVGLGAVVRATKRTKEQLQTGVLLGYWYLIENGDLQGWVSGHYLQDFKPEKKEEIWFGILKERIDNPDLNFVDRMSLHRFAKLANEHAQNEKLQGAFELAELLSLQKSFDLFNYENAQQEPYVAWEKEHAAANRVFRDEISGQWLVPSTLYWKLADEYKGKAGVDEIAWYAANAQLGGECEGDISCNLEREKITQGEYLKRHPYGRYAGESLKRLGDTLEYVLTALEKEPGYMRQIPETKQSVEELFDIIASSNPKLTERAKAFKQIKAIRRFAK